MRLSESPGVLRRPGPELGEHSRPILRDLLGLEESQIEALIRDGVVG